MHRSNAISARWRSGAIHIAGQRGLACGCRSVGSGSQTVALFCPPHRCQRVGPYPCRRAVQKPHAPAPMAQAGACASPRRLRSRRSSFQAGSLSRAPSQSPTRSWWPGASAPIITRLQWRASSSRVSQYPPATPNYPSRLPDRSRRCHWVRSSGPLCCSRLSVAGERPGAAGPQRAWNASEQSPVETPCRDSQGSSASRLCDRRR
jgi:hypothetical protein